MIKSIDSGRLKIHAKRKRVNAIALTLSMSAMAFGLFWLIWILFETIYRGLGGLNLSLFTEMTPPPLADTGGLANAIFGSAAMVGLATLLGTPVGILAGIYLAEYGQKKWLAEVVRFQRELDSALMSFRAAQRTLLVNYARLRRTMGQLDQDAGVSLR